MTRTRAMSHPLARIIVTVSSSVQLFAWTSRKGSRSESVAPHSEEYVPDGTSRAKYNSEVPNKGHDHTFFVQHTRDVFAG